MKEKIIIIGDNNYSFEKLNNKYEVIFSSNISFIESNEFYSLILINIPDNNISYNYIKKIKESNYRYTPIISLIKDENIKAEFLNLGVCKAVLDFSNIEAVITDAIDSIKIPSLMKTEDDIVKLFFNSLNKFSFILVKYNTSTKDGYYYDSNSNGNAKKYYFMDLNEQIKKLSKYLVSSDLKNDINLMIEGKKEFFIPQYFDICYDIDKNVYDPVSHKIDFSMIKYEEYGEKNLLFLLIDRTKEFELLNSKEKEISDIRNIILYSLMDNFLILCTYDFVSKDISLYYKEDNTYKTKKVYDTWDSYMSKKLLELNESSNKDQLKNDILSSNLGNLDVSKTLKYHLTIGSDPNLVHIDCRLTVGLVDGHKRLSLLLQDITESVNREKQLNKNIDLLTIKSRKDELTQLYNRNGLIDNINEIKLKLLRDNEKKHFVVFLDADKFKTVNDEYGHKEGDYALTSIANAISEFVIRTNGFAYRYGGDEFVLITSSNNIEELESELDNMNDYLSKLTNKYVLKLSYGIKELPKDIVANFNEENLKTYIFDADSNLLLAKKQNHMK